MDKKTKNIIALIIIAVLVVCLAFTIRDGDQNNNERVDFITPRSSTNRQGYRYNNAFDWSKNNEEEEKDGEEKDNILESDTKDEDIFDTNKNDAVKEKSCNCQKSIMPQGGSGNKPFRDFMMKEGTIKDNTLRTVLIIAESFLLGGATMFLILNNTNKEIKEEKNSNNKTRRVK